MLQGLPRENGKERKAEQNEQPQHYEISDYEPDLLGQLRGIGKEGAILHWWGLSERRGTSDSTQNRGKSKEALIVLSALSPAPLAPLATPPHRALSGCRVYSGPLRWRAMTLRRSPVALRSLAPIRSPLSRGACNGRVAGLACLRGKAPTAIAAELRAAPLRCGESRFRPGGNHAGFVCFRGIVEVGQRPARADHDPLLTSVRHVFAPQQSPLAGSSDMIGRSEKV